jgi:hypothetical protein
MLNFFKKLLQPRVTVEITAEEELMYKLLDMVNDEHLNAVFYNPASKLYIVNTYTDDFNDLTGSFYNNNFRRQIIAINIHSYFLNSKVDIKTDLEKLAKCLKTHKPNMLIQHDLDELVNAYQYLKSLET